MITLHQELKRSSYAKYHGARAEFGDILNVEHLATREVQLREKVSTCRWYRHCDTQPTLSNPRRIVIVRMVDNYAVCIVMSTPPRPLDSMLKGYTYLLLEAV